MWESTVNYEFYSSYEIEHKNKIFFIDVDGTIVTTMSGRFPHMIKSSDDWIFSSDTIIKTLKNLSKTFSLVLISNQTKFNDTIKEKFEMIISALEKANIKILVYILKTKAWKKPETKCYDHLLDFLTIEPVEIRVVGDACNSASNFPSYQWSNCDFEFYENLEFSNKKFYTPEKIFTRNKIIIPETKNVILMMGNPGSGKTTFVESLENYNIISGDNGLTAVKQLKLFTQYLSEDKNIVIDNLNASKKTRAKFIEPAVEMGYHIIIVWCLRDGRPFNDLREKRVPAIVYNIYSKNFEMPTSEEGVVFKM